MGRQKLLLPWGEGTVLSHIFEQWRRLVEQVAVVHGSNEWIVREMDRLRIAAAQRIENPEPERGMFSSIQCAALWAGWKKELTHFVLVLGDQPHLRETTLRELLEFSRRNPDKVCQPKWKGRPKHPVVLPRPVFLGVHTTHATDLKQFLQGRPRELVQLNDPGLELDLDYPEDYEKARKFR